MGHYAEVYNMWGKIPFLQLKSQDTHSALLLHTQACSITCYIYASCNCFTMYHWRPTTRQEFNPWCDLRNAAYLRYKGKRQDSPEALSICKQAAVEGWLLGTHSPPPPEQQPLPPLDNQGRANWIFKWPWQHHLSASRTRYQKKWWESDCWPYLKIFQSWRGRQAGVGANLQKCRFMRQTDHLLSFVQFKLQA